MAEWFSIEHANEHNLKDISVKIPKSKLTVITGISGSGKSTLAHDILFNESQRQYLEAMGLQGIEKPKVERISGASPITRSMIVWKRPSKKRQRFSRKSPKSCKPFDC